MKTKMMGYYIPSIDAKDIYIATTLNKSGYSLKNKDGEYILSKFINTLDYSLDLIELQEIWFKKFRNRKFGFTINDKNYSSNVVNVTFKYSVKDWNQVNKYTYIKLGYSYKDLEFENGIATDTLGNIVGIKISLDIENPSFANKLPKYFKIQLVEKNDGTTSYQIKKVLEPKTIKTGSQLRAELYQQDFFIDSVRFCRMKRTSGSARVGKCLFINKHLYPSLHKFELGGLKVRKGQVIDLAAFESSISLHTSSIIDILSGIRPENILIIDDYESVFKEDVVATSVKNGWLHTEEKNVTIKNLIWDGQSLLDYSAFGKYVKHGMILLRNLMFKSCCFNTNIQKWFDDNNITDVSQLNGYTRAKSIKDIKLITTPSSIKYLKFGQLDQWLDNLYPHFGIVKYDKPPKFFEGKLVQTHYQLLNTLQLSFDEMKEFLTPSMEFAQQLRTNPAVVKYYIKYPNTDVFKPFKQPILSKNDVVYNFLSVNNKFTRTKYYKDFLSDILRSFYKMIKSGHVLVNGNYSTLLGNPIEMLQYAIGKFNGESQIGIGNIHSTCFDYNQTLLGSRSPHVTMGNILIAKNTENKLIDKYINLTKQIVCINSIGENTLQRLSGADFDSDTMLLTDDKLLVSAGMKNYKIFKTPTSLVTAQKVKRYYTPEQMADLDTKTSVNLIGQIINLSQELNSLLWHKLNENNTYDDIKELYYDICQLDVMSGIEIDKAKKEFEVDNLKELKKITNKYKEELLDDNGKRNLPFFFSHIAREKGYYNPDRKNYIKYNTSMDYLQTIINSFRTKNCLDKTNILLSDIFNMDKFVQCNINHEKVNQVLLAIGDYENNRKSILLNKSLDTTEKKEACFIQQENLKKYVSSLNLGYSTICELIRMADSKEYFRIRHILLEVLCSSKHKSFMDVIQNSSEDFVHISQTNELEEDFKLYKISFKTYKK